MLRDVMTSVAGIETWPCDEINYILRHGNLRHPSDQFSAENATPGVKKYLRRTFAKYARQFDADLLVEKTCANSLRVSFLNEVFPEARYIFIVRDGLDATGSAKLRWTAKLDFKYLLEKARFVPPADLPYYGFRYFWARLHKFFSAEKRVAFWGPALPDMEKILDQHSLNEICAIQWQQCVETADLEFNELPREKVCRVRYEKFVNQPENELARIFRFLRVTVPAAQISAAIKDVSADSIGKGRKALGAGEVAQLEMLIGETLKKHGYSK